MKEKYSHYILYIWTIIQRENAGPAPATESKEFICNAGAAFPQKDPLEKVMATHSTILAWRIPWTE